ncbi:hypothetical protein KKG48_00990 [Patescibacteria group bacterium]|nr:hypothetical protein [Patescibacteria group bacterium]MCG2695237.1 hypothetical protein [Candidatus Parcubacteria bacterium]
MNQQETLRDAVVGIFGEEICSPGGYRRKVVQMSDDELRDFVRCIFDSTRYIDNEQQRRLERACC